MERERECRGEVVARPVARLVHRLSPVCIRPNARSTFNALWSEGMAELTEQVHLENPLLGLPDGAEPPPPVR